MKLLCRLCLTDNISGEFGVELKYCQAFKDNPVRLDMFITLCTQFSLEVLSSSLLDKICNTCDVALLSAFVFVENCLKAKDYFTSLSNKDINDFNLHKTSLLDAKDNIKTNSLELNGVKNENIIECKYCCRKFTNTSTLDNHIQKCHTNELEPQIIINENKCADELFNEGYRCHHCQVVFETKKLLRGHIKHHENLFICHCGKRFKRQIKLNKHYLKIHSKDDFNCSECGKIFKSSNSLEYHQNIHRNIKPFHCSSCEESFFSPNSLNKHQRLAHGSLKNENKTQQFLCDNCGVSFARRYHLKRHRIIRHTNPPLAFPCDVCGKAFVDPSRLRAHQLIHTDQRDFECGQCDRAFRTQSAKQSHTRRVHLNLRPFPCPTCAKAFKSKSHLKKHIRTHTGEKPFSCPFCSYISAEHSNLKKHMKIHNRL